MRKMTPWFPSSIKPVRAGVYEVYTPPNFANKYAYFDKNGWRLCAASVKRAECEKKWLNDNFFSSMNFSSSMWRGFNEKQS